MKNNTENIQAKNNEAEVIKHLNVSKGRHLNFRGLLNEWNSTPPTKQNQINQQTQKSMYHMPVLDAKIEAFEKQFDHEINIDAENNGLRDKPTLLEEDTRPYVREHHHKIEAMASEIAATLQPSALISEVGESEKTTERTLRDLYNQLNTAKEKSQELLQGKACGRRECSKWRMPLGWIAICVPLLGDGLLNLPAFQVFGYNFIEALGASVILAACLAVLAHVFDKIVGLGKTVWHRRAIAGSMITILACFFYYLAKVRAEFLSSQANGDNPHGDIHFSPIPLALFSTLLFVSAVAINHFIFPNEAQRKSMREYDANEKMQQEHTDGRERLEAQIEAVKRQHEELVQTNGSIYVYGGKLEERLFARAKIGYSKWCRVNMMHRPDQGRPLCFNNDEYPFTFTRHFKPIEF